MPHVQYNSHLQRVLNTYSYNHQYDNMNATDDELCVLILRWNKCPYGTIQQYLGNPSKKWIRNVLLKYDPTLIELDCNYNKKKAVVKMSPEEKQILHILENTQVFDYEDFTFSIEDDKLYITTNYDKSLFSAWDKTTQQQILNQVKCNRK